MGTMYNETQHNQHSTSKLIYKYILFRNFINSVWALCGIKVKTLYLLHGKDNLFLCKCQKGEANAKGF